MLLIYAVDKASVNTLRNKSNQYMGNIYYSYFMCMPLSYSCKYFTLFHMLYEIWWDEVLKKQHTNCNLIHILNWKNMQSGRVTCQVTHSRQANADSAFRLCCRRRCDSTLVLDANVLLQKSQGKGLSPETDNTGLHPTKQSIIPIYKTKNTWFLAIDVLIMN